MTRAIPTYLMCAALAAFAQAQRAPLSEKGTPNPVSVNGVLAQLDQRVAEVDFENAPLEQVIDWISSLTSMNVVVNWQTLEYAGVERDKPVTLAVRNIPLSQLIWLLLEEAGGPDLNLAYQARDNLLIISTEEEFGRAMIVRVYDVADLTVRVPKFREAPHVSLEQAGNGRSAMSSSGSGSGEPEEDGGDSGDPDAQQLADLVVNAIDPDSWSGNGGAGTVQVYRDMLIVRNNAFVHQAIGGRIKSNR